MRKFTHLGVEWEAESTGGSHGIGSRPAQPTTSREVLFRTASDPPRERIGHLRHRDLSQATDDDLRAALDAAIAADSGQP